MKDRVVCIDDSKMGDTPKIIKGEIYTPIKGSTHPEFICLVEFGTDYAYRITCFRPVDDTFGEWVEETIMKDVQIEELINA